MSKQKILVPEWWLQKKYAEYCEWAVLHEAVPLSYGEQGQIYDACVEFGIADKYEVVLAVIDVETNFRNVMGDNGDHMGICKYRKSGIIKLWLI